MHSWARLWSLILGLPTCCFEDRQRRNTCRNHCPEWTVASPAPLPQRRHKPPLSSHLKIKDDQTKIDFSVASLFLSSQTHLCPLFVLKILEIVVYSGYIKVSSRWRTAGSAGRIFQENSHYDHSNNCVVLSCSWVYLHWHMSPQNGQEHLQ